VNHGQAKGASFLEVSTFEIDAGETPQERIDQLLKLTERYCVVFQTLNARPDLTTRILPNNRSVK
jgi:uncharacterized OsmC-like protein